MKDKVQASDLIATEYLDFEFTTEILAKMEDQMVRDFIEHREKTLLWFLSRPRQVQWHRQGR